MFDRAADMFMSVHYQAEKYVLYTLNLFISKH